MSESTEEVNYNTVQPVRESIIPVVDFKEEDCEQFRYYIANNE